MQDDGAVETQQCVACGQQIPKGVSLCSVCKSYQRNWKNHLQYSAGIVALIALVASALVWLWASRKDVWPRDDVRVVYASSLGSAVVANSGDRDVFVSHLLFTMPGRQSDWTAPRLVFDEKLAAGQFSRREFPKAKFDTGEFVRGISDADFERLVSRAANGDPCLELVFSVASDPLLKELTIMPGPPLNTFKIGGYLEYWGLRSTSAVDVAIKGIGALRRDRRPECHT